MIALSQFPGIDPVKDSSAALQAALNSGQSVVWDCPVNCVMGSDITKTVFVPDGSDVTFTTSGRLDVDASGFPALAFMHVSAIWRGTKIRYTGTPSVTMPTAPGAWTDKTARAYLLANKLNTFSTSAGTFWTGPSNTSSLISIRGASNVTLQGGKIYVDDDAPASRFVQTAIALDNAYAVGAIVGTGAPVVAPAATVSDFMLDGTIMGVVGGGSNVSFRGITRRRYSDLQDTSGLNIGGVGYWSAPPHFIYLQGSPATPMTAKLRDIVDEGVFCGAGRRSPSSGYINSIKIELNNGSSIDGYYSRCLDGGIGVLSNSDGTQSGGWARNMFFIVDTSLRSVDARLSTTAGVFFPSAHPYPASEIQASVADLALGWPVQTNAVPAAVNLNLSVLRNFA